jgi:signal transduction histidine kinase
MAFAMWGFKREIDVRRKAEDELTVRDVRYRQLAQRIETIREEERKRLSRELHDDIGQTLTALKVDLAVVESECSGSGRVKQKMADMQKLLSSGIHSVHSLCRRLRPGALDDLSLEDALAGLVDDWKQRNDATCELHADVRDAALSDEIRTAVFRLVQEALTNVSRYARASEVQIRLTAGETALRFSVADNGCGMEPGAENKPTSFGLLGMHERVVMLGGRLRIDSAPGKGTLIEGSLPLAREQASAD